MIPIPREQFTSRINQSSPSANYLSGVVNELFNIVENPATEQERAKITNDRNLSDVGKRELLDKITKAQIRTICEKSKPLRSAKSQILGERMHLGKPKFDPTDIAAAAERVEVRNALRSEPDLALRWQKAERFFAQAKQYAEALISGPDAGLDVERLKELHYRFLKKYHGIEAAEINGREKDLDPVEGAVGACHLMMKAKSGLNDYQYQQLVQGHEDEIDGRTKA